MIKWTYRNHDELYHHGIKGMKWGVRKYQNKDGSLTSAGKKHQREMSENEKVIASRKQDIKNRRTMSDTDIKKKIERLKLEKQLKDLTEDDVVPGRKFARDIMSSAGKKTLTMFAAGAMAYGVKVAMTKEFNFKEAAGYMAANPNKKK